MRLSNNPSAQTALLSRSDTLKLFSQKAWCDVLIVGGGIHGATFAHLAALNGLRTVLLERKDYACGTSSRSSKLAHGGVRYLEHFDFSQVAEGIRERERLLQVAPHLVTRCDFVLPILRGEYVLPLALRAGLTLYSLMSRGRAPLPKRVGVPPQCAAEFAGGFQYQDGLLSDTRLVIERILAARQEGAHCLNYTESEVFLPNPSGVEVRARDLITGKKLSIAAGAVINTAGPWIAEAGGLTTKHLSSEVRFSRGPHILFSVPWHAPALVFPMREGKKRIRGRYYFVTPHPSGTLVGTTEREVAVAEQDPLPSSDELEEIFSQLQRDLPGSGLTRDAAHYCFSGIRTLPASTGSKDTASISRRPYWHHRNGIFSLIGGKYTTAAATCEAGLQLVLKIRETELRMATLSGRMLPGAANFDEHINRFKDACQDAHVPVLIMQRAITRFGARVSKLLEYADGLHVVGDCALKGEFRLAVEQEQVQHLEDLLRRRLELELLPGHGLASLQWQGLSELFSQEQLASEVADYQERMRRIQSCVR